MTSAAFEPAIPAIERPQTHSRDGTATGISIYHAIYRDLLSSGILRSVEWQFLTDVPGQPVGPIFALNMGPIGCPATSVPNCHSTLRKIPKERRSHFHRDGHLKLCKSFIIYYLLLVGMDAVIF